MPFPRAGRRGRRLVGGIVGVVAVVGLAAPTAPSYADDDYPYAGLGTCPLVPLPPHAHKPGTPGKPGHTKPGPTKPGGHNGPGTQPTKPGTPGKPGDPATTPPRACAKHIWLYQGSYGDPWGFALRNCTSFVAWRLRETNGDTAFVNDMDGQHWGDARTWDDTAEALGYLVDDVPAVGAVAQTDDGRVGHVAWVSAVGDGTVTVEEYNYYVAGGYDVRTVPTSAFRYLHVDDVAPAPDLGSTRSAATAVDVRGAAWTARTTPAGDLVVRSDTGRATRLGARGAWSTTAAPSVTVDATGRTWVAAVDATGRVLTGHTRGTSARWAPLRAVAGGPWATTSSPTLAVDGRDRVHLLTVSATGDLVERHTAGRSSDRWSRGDRMGRPGSWSTQAAPAATADATGRLWLAAVTRHGTLQVRHTDRRVRRWTGFAAADHRTWSVTSSPSLTLADDGRLWLSSVSARGILVVRHSDAHVRRWQSPAPVGGRWSPYSSPATAVDASGRLWLAAVTTHGRLRVRGTTPFSTRWQAFRTLARSASVTDGPALLAPAGGGVRVGVVTRSGRQVWRTAGGAGPAASSVRGGAFLVRLHP